MKFSRLLRYVFLVGLLLVLLLSGSSQSRILHAATPEPTQVGTQTAITLGQTYTTKDKGISFNYPDTWVVLEVAPDFILVGPSDALMSAAPNSPAPTLKSGQAILQLEVVTAENFGTTRIDLSDDPVAMLQSLIKPASPDSSNSLKFSEVTAEKIGDINAARVALTSSGSDGLIYSFLVDKTVVLAVVFTAPGEVDNNTEMLKAFAASIKLAPAAATPAASQVATMVATVSQ